MRPNYPQKNILTFYNQKQKCNVYTLCLKTYIFVIELRDKVVSLQTIRIFL